MSSLRLSRFCISSQRRSPHLSIVPRLSNRVSVTAVSLPKLRLFIFSSAFSFLLLASAILCNQSLATSGQVSEKVLWSFNEGTSDGTSPNAPLVMDPNRNLYGTTTSGGNNGSSSDFAGTLFKLTPTGQESVLWNFGSGSSGFIPEAGLIIDNNGNLYGTTSSGGLYDDFETDVGGTAFVLTPTGQETVLWNFGNGSDGQNPYSSLLIDGSGNLFGTTFFGGNYLGGTAFELTAAGQESVLWSFGNGSDGSGPQTALITDASGDFYGTTVAGGAYGAGTLFKLTPVTTPGGASSTTSYTESILWSFGNGTDGKNPGSSPIIGANGNLFGVTGVGGLYGGGAAYELTPDGQETVLWNFRGSGGQFPNGMIIDANGNLYGVTRNGGANSACGFPASGCGTVYELTPPAVAGNAWTETILWDFGPSPDGYNPSGNLLLDASGNLYGVTSGGGANFNGGTVFEISGVGAADGQISLSEQHLQFPTTAVGGASSIKLAIRNTGKGQLTGSIATPPAPFGLQGSGSFNLAPRTETKVTLTFTPSAPTRAHRLAAVTSNSVKDANINLDLRGIGIAPPSSVALK